MVSLIVPAAGKSSRFPGMKPKWLLTHPKGNLMVVESLMGLDLKNVKKIYLTVLDEHIREYASLDGIKQAFLDAGLSDMLEIVSLERETKNQPETVYETIKRANISGPIFIKDVDNFFSCKVSSKNSVSIQDLHSMDLVHASNKSFIESNKHGHVINIVEKQIISSMFCAGGYSFASGDDFKRYFLKLSSHKNLYISHIIFDMCLDGHIFTASEVSKYIDWGTLIDWNNFKSTYSTLFVDIDGVLVNNSSAYFNPTWGSTEGISENINTINSLYESGRSKIILTTSRKTSSKKKTEAQLKRVGLKYHQIIYDLFHCKRIIINDYAPTNPYKSCESINIPRNSNTLKDLIQDSVD
tara:strand:- start:2429 stop:3490 length:1062 start_codon:yes stop_codon:yes gene_type:complete